MEILDTGNLSLLIIKGNHSPIELKLAWEMITTEYGEKVKNEKSDSIFELWKKIEYHKWLINTIALTCGSLKHQYDKDHAEWLASNGYSFIEYNADRDEYYKSILRVQIEAQYLHVMLNQYQNEYQMLLPDPETITKESRETRMRDLAILSRFQGYRIDPSTHTVEEYISIVNDFIEDVKQKKQMAEKGIKKN